MLRYSPVFSHVMRLDQSRASENLWWIINGHHNAQQIKYLLEWNTSHRLGFPVITNDKRNKNYQDEHGLTNGTKTFLVEWAEPIELPTENSGVIGKW